MILPALHYLVWRSQPFRKNSSRACGPIQGSATPDYSLLTRRSALLLKWFCRTGGEAFKRRLVHSVALTIMA